MCTSPCGGSLRSCNIQGCLRVLVCACVHQHADPMQMVSALAQVSTMQEQVLAFQAQAKKLPKVSKCDLCCLPRVLLRRPRNSVHCKRGMRRGFASGRRTRTAVTSSTTFWSSCRSSRPSPTPPCEKGGTLQRMGTDGHGAVSTAQKACSQLRWYDQNCQINQWQHRHTPSMPRCRHWKELMQITGTQLDLAPEVFRLQHLLNAKLITHRDEVCTCFCVLLFSTCWVIASPYPRAS